MLSCCHRYNCLVVVNILSELVLLALALCLTVNLGLATAYGCELHWYANNKV